MSRLVRLPSSLGLGCVLLIAYGASCSLLTEGTLSDKPLEVVSAGSGGGGQGGVDGAGGAGGASCQLEPMPPGGMPCPAICSSCDGGICVIDASADNAYEQMPINCPEDYACDLRCDGVDSCAGATISCPESYACSVTCTAVRSCKDAVLNCASGVCSLDCASGANACQDAQLSCGSKACTATCGPGQVFPDITCEPSCKCIEC